MGYHHKKPRLNLIYLGNQLAAHGKTPTSVETLGLKLQEIAHVWRYSDKHSQALRLVDMLRACWRHRREADAAIIDTYSGRAFYYAWACAWLLRLLRIKYIPILHGGNLPDRLKQSPALCRQLFGSAWINVAPSGYLHHYFSEAGFRVELIPNYIELEQYPFRHRSLARPKILWVRSFHELYRPHWAIGILEQLLEKYPDTELCMVGPDKDGSLERCRKLAEGKGLADKVRFTGRLSKPDWITLSARYDIFLNTTSADNTPVSVMEAMALGMLVTTTKVGGIPWLFEDGIEGIMVAEANEEKLTNAIVEGIGQPEKAVCISRMARKKAEEWDWKVVKGKWRKVLSLNEKSS